MRFAAWVGLGLWALFGATGCRGAHIKEAYLARDSGGHRKTNCFVPAWGHYFVFVDLLSFKDDTLLTPYLVDDDSGNGVAIAYEDDELAEFGNLAVGKGEANVAFEMKGPPLNPNDPSDNSRGPLQAGNFTWQFFLDDHSTADESLPFTVSDGCGE
jgi:hypothetical protein